MKIFKLIDTCNGVQSIGSPFPFKFAEPKSVLVILNRRQNYDIFWNEINPMIHYILSYDTL